jgi:hypothetical protein
MIEQLEMGVPDIIGFRLSGKLMAEDYKVLAPCIEEVVQRKGKVKLFAEVEDLHGWDWRAAWDEIKFGARHYRDIDRIAMVGDRKWEEVVVDWCKPLTKTQIRYFDKSKANAAWYWLQEDVH